MDADSGDSYKSEEGQDFSGDAERSGADCVCRKRIEGRDCGRAARNCWADGADKSWDAAGINIYANECADANRAWRDGSDRDFARANAGRKQHADLHTARADERNNCCGWRAEECSAGKFGRTFHYREADGYRAAFCSDRSGASTKYICCCGIRRKECRSYSSDFEFVWHRCANEWRNCWRNDDDGVEWIERRIEWWRHTSDGWCGASDWRHRAGGWRSSAAGWNEALIFRKRRIQKPQTRVRRLGHPAEI